ncbi:MAG: hypothetical protein V8T01_05355 [Oscillospiraceae bacterium]
MRIITRARRRSTASCSRSSRTTTRKALQLESGELDLALLDAEGRGSSRQGRLHLLRHEDERLSRHPLQLLERLLDRRTAISSPRSATPSTGRRSSDAVLLGQGMAAYGPLQRNVYNNENVEHYDYDPGKGARCWRRRAA